MVHSCVMLSGFPCSSDKISQIPKELFLTALRLLQVLRYFDYVFTGVFTFEMIIKVRDFKTSIKSFSPDESG